MPAYKFHVVLKSFTGMYLLPTTHVFKVLKLPFYVAMNAILFMRFKHLFSICHRWLSIIFSSFTKRCYFPKRIAARDFSLFSVFLFSLLMCCHSLLLWPPWFCFHGIMSFVRAHLSTALHFHCSLLLRILLPLSSLNF